MFDPLRPALLGGTAVQNRVAPGEQRGIHVLEGHRARVEALVQLGRQLAKGTEGAGHHQEAPAGAQDRSEGTQHARSTQVVRVHERADQLGPRSHRRQSRRRVREHDVDATVTVRELVGQLLHGGAVANVEHLAAHLRPRGG
jgi:hypothetical protein